MFTKSVMMQKFVLQTFRNMPWSKKCTSQHLLPSSRMISGWFLPLRATIGYSLKARIVSTVCDIEDGSHLCCCVRLHLLKEGLQVGALPRKRQVNIQSFPKHPLYCKEIEDQIEDQASTFSSQNLISVMGPGMLVVWTFPANFSDVLASLGSILESDSVSQ